MLEKATIKNSNGSMHNAGISYSGIPSCTVL